MPPPVALRREDRHPREKEKNPFVSIDQIVKTVRSKDSLFARDRR
jgi:hypothetical protein